MVGIINVQWFDNPGAVWLAYALQQTVNNMGYENKIIDYASGGGQEVKLSEIQKIVKAIEKVKNRILKLQVVNSKFIYIQLRQRHEKYQKFREQYLERTERFTDQDNKLLYDFDAYIVGSDVVWKPSILLSKDEKVYFLSFLNENTDKIKIAFAASVGTADNNILKKYRVLYKEKVENFDYVSVREKQTADFLNSIMTKKAITLMDPVFLLDKKEYINLIGTKKVKEKYIYFYMLELNEMAVEYAIYLSEKTGYKILYDLHTLDNMRLVKKLKKYGYPCVNDGPLEFLEKIQYSEYVVTNSFHGTAFSIIMQKEFYTFSCYNEGINVSLRMENLLKELNLYNRYNVIQNRKLEKINYDQINEKIGMKRKESIKFLQNAMTTLKNK